MNDLERIARLLCHSDGYDPDALVYPMPATYFPVGVKGFAMAPPGIAPHAQWTIYEHYVKGTLDAVLAGSEGADLREIIQHVICGEEIPLQLSEDEIVVDDLPLDDVDPPPAPGWRVKYGL